MDTVKAESQAIEAASEQRIRVVSSPMVELYLVRAVLFTPCSMQRKRCLRKHAWE